MINVRKGLGDGNYMEMYYGSKGINNYIEICVNEKDFLTEKNYYVIRMLEDNDIDEIIKPAISKLDNNLFLRYQVNSFFVLDKYLIKSKPDITFLEAILNTVCNCEKIAERYLLNVDDLVISPDYMLWDDKTKSQVDFLNKEDGIFFMNDTDFFKYFTHVEICYILFNSATQIYPIEGEQNLRNASVFNIQYNIIKA